MSPANPLGCLQISQKLFSEPAKNARFLRRKPKNHGEKIAAALRKKNGRGVFAIRKKS
ncbi:MAG: hypothetical protein LUD52_02490 [Opitutae bacterium]|nr:hypothetical protein [Opitutae bacterium]